MQRGGRRGLLFEKRRDCRGDVFPAFPLILCVHALGILKCVSVVNSTHTAPSASASLQTSFQRRRRAVKVMNGEEEVGAHREPGTLITTFISFTAPTCKFSRTIHQLRFLFYFYLHSYTTGHVVLYHLLHCVSLKNAKYRLHIIKGCIKRDFKVGSEQLAHPVSERSLQIQMSSSLLTDQSVIIIFFNTFIPEICTDLNMILYSSAVNCDSFCLPD